MHLHLVTLMCEPSECAITIDMQMTLGVLQTQEILWSTQAVDWAGTFQRQEVPIE